MGLLTDVAIKNLKPEAKLYSKKDGDGLFLFVEPTGSKIWRFRFSWNKKQQVMSFGKYPALSIRLARKYKDEARELLAQKLDPRLFMKHNGDSEKTEEIQNNSDDDRITFKQYAEKHIEHLKNINGAIPEGSRNVKTQLMPQYFEKDVYPSIGDKALADVTRKDLLAIQRQIEDRDARSVATKLRGYLNEIFKTAIAENIIELNPASELQSVALDEYDTEHYAHLEMKDIPELLLNMKINFRGARQVYLALRLMLLTGVRGCEVRFARPEEFDVENALWTIPAERLKQIRIKKTKKNQPRTQKIPPYIVPLSKQAVEVVREMLKIRYPGQKYMLRGRYDPQTTVCENTFNLAVRKMGFVGRLHSHGFRGTISTALNEQDFNSKWINAQLSHQSSKDEDGNKKSKSAKAYDHAKYIPQRREMMQKWADWLDEMEKEVMS